jgi:cbb3-type cytochrome oxidase subunit 3
MIDTIVVIAFAIFMFGGLFYIYFVPTKKKQKV